MINLINVVDYFSTFYESFVILGDFNEVFTHNDMSKFMEHLNLSSLIKTPTCFKSDDGRCIDLILTNKNRCFQKSGSFETGVSDHHHLIFTFFKSSLIKCSPKYIRYRTFRNFHRTNFEYDLSSELLAIDQSNFNAFHNVFTDVLNRHASATIRVVRGNQKPHITRNIRKAIMKRSYYKNKANKSGDSKYIKLYKKQRNIIVNMNRAAKRSYFHSHETNSKDFWSSCKPFFSNKSRDSEKISLLDDVKNEFISDEGEVATMFNKYFIDLIRKLDLKPWKSKVASSVSLNELDSILLHYADPKCKKGSQWPNSNENNSDILKLSEVIPVFKKGDNSRKENYRPISILNSFSKILERLLFNQISSYFQPIFSSLLCGFRSKYNTQNALFRLIGKWHQCLDKSGVVGTVLMDLSKAFDSIDHGLLISKLAAYGFDRKSLYLMKSYLSGRFQRTKICSSFSEWLSIVFGVPQGSILGPLLFNIFINDLLLFIEKTDICNFADDNTIYTCGSQVNEVIADLQHDLNNVLAWFENNQLVANPAKFQMMFLACPHSNTLSLRINNNFLVSSESVKLLGITIDRCLTFNEHISNLCKKGNSNVRCVYRIRRFISFEQSKLLLNSNILSIFTYCPIIWMYCSAVQYKLIISTHKRALRAVTKDYHSSYQDLLVNCNCVQIHELHLRIICIEIYKTLTDENPSFMQSFYAIRRISYNLRRKNSLLLPSTSSTRFGTRSFLFRSCLLWNSLPDKVKSSLSIKSFKKELISLNLSDLCTFGTNYGSLYKQKYYLRQNMISPPVTITGGIHLADKTGILPCFTSLGSKNNDEKSPNIVTSLCKMVKDIASILNIERVTVPPQRGAVFQFAQLTLSSDQ
ncbi:uncharacterized protein LOC130625097 [Hydractinia symbiolongicarpus]|uniref:uncharacterized protein LOC130625097 n=1 Tax=Hydractinia symbiolongicarpus TaxID=13093 RepID=UPI00254A31B9|nr:uncharacterized protein LOC130625097 [Hydractinia symbiolongicarpus]